MSLPRDVDGADTIVVGAGTAGAVIASRLTERSDRDVLLLEAGPDYPDPDALPDDLRDGTRNSVIHHDWGFHHRPSPDGSAVYYPRGKVVGGSSAVNTCIALRGQPYDYDEWAALGMPEWSFDRCLPAFRRLESDLDVDNEWHGRDGPVPIRRHPEDELVPWQRAFLEACNEMGFPPCADHNDPTSTGHGPHAMNKVDGVRMSAARCYLTPEVRGRDNLRIRARTLVRRVLVVNRRVTGVEVETNGRVERLRAGRVVLCAGAVCTPGILLRSGIGPRDELARLGVEMVADVPAVGSRLLDHGGSAILMLPRPGTPLGDCSEPFLQSTLRFTPRGSPFKNEMQLQPANYFPFKAFCLPIVAITTMVGKPRSAGTIRFPTADPHEKPRLDSGFCAHPEERRLLAEALQLAHLIAADPVVQELASFFYPSERTLMRLDALSEWLPRNCGSGYHPCGTVPMGPEGSAEAALDPRGQVRGVEGLAVADASVFPTCPSPNTNLTAFMVAERMAEWL